MTKNAPAVFALVVLAILIGRFTIHPPVARAQSGCGVASLKGSYSLAANGFFYYQDGSQGVYGSAGVAALDGNGAITGTDTVNLDGNPTRNRQFTGTYTINSNCTGTMNLVDSQNKPILNMDLVIADGGKEVDLVDYDSGAIITGAAKLQ